MNNPVRLKLYVISTTSMPFWSNEYINKKIMTIKEQHLEETVFGKTKNLVNLFKLERKKEKDYILTTGINCKHCSHIPFFFRNKNIFKKEGVILSFFMRPSGIFSFHLEKKWFLENKNNKEETINNLIDETLKKAYNLRKKSFNSAKNFIISASNNFFLDKLIYKTHLQFKTIKKALYNANYSPPIILILINAQGYSLSSINKKFQEFKEEYHKSIIKRHSKDIRFHSRNFHFWFSADSSLTGRSFKKLSLKILNGVGIGYGVHESLNSFQKAILSEEFHEASPADWDCLIHFHNPLILSQKSSLHSPLGNPLIRSWFISIDQLLNLRTFFSLSFEKLILSEKNYDFSWPIIIKSISKLPTGKFLLLSKNALYVSTISNSEFNNELEKEIFNVLKKAIDDSIEIIVSQKHEDIDYGKLTARLTINQIRELLGMAANKRNYTLIKRALKNLVKQGFVKMVPYEGKGRKNNSMAYYLSREYSQIKQILLELIKIKILQPIKELENTIKEENL